MKKILLSAVALGLVGMSAKAQLLDEDFATEIPSGWTILEEDGLTSSTGQAAWASWAHNTVDGNGVACSSSWYDNNGAGPTDDWLITPAIMVPGTGNYRLTWNGTSTEAPTYAEEYEVLMSTTGTATTDFTTTLATINDEVAAPGTNHVQVLPGSASGQTIYIAFRHTSADESMLLIDNVVVEEALDNDIKIVSVDMDPTVQAGNVDVIATVKNNGTNGISSISFSYDAGSGPVNATINQNIAAGASAQITHTTPLNATTAGSPHTLNVCATITGDENTGNDCANHNLSVVDQVGTRLALLELYTSSTCPPCYSLNYSLFDGSGLNAGLSALNANSQTNADIAVVKYQVNWPGNGDHAYNSEVGERVAKYGVNGAPTPYVNAQDYPFNTFNSANVQTGQDEIAFIDVNGTFTITGTSVSVDVEIDPYGDYTGAKLYVALLDKEYSATSDASFSNNEAEFHHVFRKFIANGTAINLTSGTQFTSTETTTFTINSGLPAQGSFDVHAGSDREVVIFVEDANGNILNAAVATGNGADIEEETNAVEFGLYPNPAKDVTYLNLSLENASKASVNVINSMGQIVFNNNLSTANGTQTVAINTSNIDNGLYFVNVTVDGKTSTKRLSISK